MIAPLILSAVALWTTGKPVTMTCPNTGWESSSVVAGDRVWLGQMACRDAARGGGAGLLVVLHELGHTIGFTDEREATCFALMRMRATLRRFWHLRAAEVERRWRDAVAFMRAYAGPEYQCSTAWWQVGLTPEGAR